MKTTRKILLALVLTLAVAAVMSVCAFAAFDLDVELPAGVVKGDAKWVDSGYADIDAEGSGWIMIAKTGKDYSGTTETYPTIATADCGRFYWNKATDKGVYVVTSSNMSANWADWTPVSAANPTAADEKKMYAFASAFVDEMFGYYGSGAYQAALGGDVPADAEASVYVNGSNIGKADKYVVYERWVNANKASKQWTNFTVTKASYDSFVAKKAELEAAGTTGEALEDALVEFVYANFAGYKMARNVKENGSFVMLTWVWQQLSEAGYVFDTVEFRTKEASAYFSTFGLAIRALDADTVLFDDAITRLSLTETDRGFLYDMDTLTTFAHVDFNDDGTYTGTFTDGAIDLRGFDTITPYKTPAQYTSYLLRSSAAIKEVIWFASALADGVEVAGIIDQIALRDCTALEKFTIPASVTLKEIKANAFNGCKALKVIDVKGAVADDMTIDASAFTGVSGLTIKVYSDLDKENMENALVAAGVSATVETTKVEDPDGGVTVSIPNVITADGFMLRTQSYNGLRALFSFDEDKATAVAAETGFELVEYGAIAASAANYELAGSGEALLAVADGKKIQRIVIFADDGTGLNKYVDVDAKQYCIAVKDFVGANTLKEIYVAGYAMWSNGTDTVVTVSEYVSSKVNKTISLYTLTLEMFKAGVINSQMADEICVWDVLKNGAFSVTEAETKAPSDLLTLTQGYEYDAEGKFTYVDLPLRAWNMYKNASGNVVWNSRGVTVEETATTGILWSVLVDGDNLLVVYRADEAFEGTATLPKLSDSYGVSAPFSEKYFRVTAESQVVTDPTANGLLKTATIYSPIFTDENSAKIKTIVVDYGVDKFGEQSLSAASVTTIVYPEGMTSGNYLLSGCTALKNFTYATADKTYLDAYDVSSLVDLTGLAQISDYGVAQNAAAIENILLPEAAKIKNGQQYGFGGAKALTRVWTVGFDMPEAGVMDLSQTKITTICKGYFNNLDNIDDVYMPETFKSIGAYSMATTGQTTDTARWNVFGNNSSATKLNIHVANWDALNVIANTFYEARQNPAYNNGKENSGIEHIVDFLQITYEGVTKTVLEWRADFPAQPAA
ncbi:MAG: leucine-rich repeat protein [Clostridia bacterium]|nr:leucine-rich repeat protein [Clostridia bacterium]